MGKWNHSICWNCWVEQKTLEDGWIEQPIRITGLTETELSDQCCYCDRLTIEGIYTRSDPTMTACKGVHKGDAEEQAVYAEVTQQ